jgi:hypothetical protein
MFNFNVSAGAPSFQLLVIPPMFRMFRLIEFSIFAKYWAEPRRDSMLQPPT